MKKFLIGFVVLVVLVLGGLKIYEVTNYGGTTYYTQIKADGTKLTEKDDAGKKYVNYGYNQMIYDEDGSGRRAKFNANKSRPLKRDAYLKLTYNKNKGITSWEAINKNEVPSKALKQIEK
jgi:uncharacterized protein (TIGR01655 family)